MTWGRDTDEHEARDQVEAFLDAGGNLIDTADVYADGASERLLGRLLAEDGRREQVVLATKAVSRPGTERRFDASRRHILNALEGSLRRLGVDTIDLWQLDAWDPWTPLEETLAAIDSAVSSGKVRYAGVSNYAGWQLAQASTSSSLRDSSQPLISNQVEYSLLQRGVEREVVPAAEALGVGLLPWSPLGRGVLTGKYRNSTPADSRAANKAFSSFVQPYLTEDSRRIVDAVCTAAQGLDAQPVEVALAWVRDQPGVVAPILGARTAAQLKVALASVKLELPAQLRSALNDISRPERGYPEYGWNQR
ncbi:MAG: aryl-alcohol dehydrogenase-like predicted oxidoreductase [Actinomycetes bacterium]|jgi:aryl-alcohol dehydrogenase-like predicted oxidoreductase